MGHKHETVSNCIRPIYNYKLYDVMNTKGSRTIYIHMNIYIKKSLTKGDDKDRKIDHRALANFRP